MSFYWVAHEHEAPAGPPVELCGLDEQPLALVSQEFARSCRMEGTCRLGDGRLLNAACNCNCAGGLCFQSIDSRRYPWGRGSAQRALVPFHSIATDTSVLPSGLTLYVPELEGLILPSGRQHDGCVMADDTGGAVSGREMDLFVARRSYWRTLRQDLPTKVTAYVDPERCPQKRSL